MMNDAMMLMKSRHNNTKQYLTGSARRAFALLLLLGAIAFVNTQQIQAQPVSITAEMPDAFETKNPVIGDGEFYYIQFYKEEANPPYLYQSFLGELGEGGWQGGNDVNRIQAMDYLPFAANRLWTLVAGSDATHFKLKSKRGFFVYYENNRYYTTADETKASEFTLTDRGSYRAGFKEIMISNTIRFGRWAGSEWAGIINPQGYNDVNCLRFAKLKSNAAHIIYYRDEHADNQDNTDPQAATTRHYLTYSGTDASATQSAVSSRRSIIPSDKSLWTLPTAAAYHQDGLWSLEEAGNDGEFYIKKYGTEQYMNAVPSGNNYISGLGTKDAVNGKYKLEDPSANRYTPIQNIVYGTTQLTSDMFHGWNGYWNGASATSNPQDGVNGFEFNIGKGTNFGSAALVAGTGAVDYLTYADLGDNTKMIINGTAGLSLRVLMSRQESNSGPMVEKTVTIGDDGKAVVDLTNLVLNNATANITPKMTYVNKNEAETSYGEVSQALCGYNKISSNQTVGLAMEDYGRNYIAYLEVDASAIQGTIKKVTLTGDFEQISTNGRKLNYGVGYNSSEWSSSMTWNTADKSIITLGATKEVASANGEQELSFDITAACLSGSFQNNKKVTILVYNTVFGGGYIKNPRVKVEYDPNTPVSYAHLNAIKTGWAGTSGTVSSITLVNENNLTVAGSRYLHHSNGDGWQVPQWTNKWNDVWNAAFYPVEVPASGKDEFFQVLVGLTGSIGGKSWIELSGTKGMSVVDQDDNVGDGHVYRGTFTPTATQQNAFQYLNFNTKSYQQIVIKFGAEVPAGWHLHTYGAWNVYENLEGKTEVTIDLQPGTPMDDFTIFNLGDNVPAITITDVYFTSSNQPTEMVGYDGWAYPYSEIEDERILWQLEQVDDYTEFRLKNPNNGSYLSGLGQVTEPNDPNGEVGTNVAEVYTNQKFWGEFYLKWYLPTKSVEKEIPINGYVRHRESYLKAYADDQVITDQNGLRKQGLARDVDSDWKELTNKKTGNPYLLDGFIQQTNYFEITHYIKKGASKVIEFPTVLNRNNDHIFFQRFYNYNEDDTQMDLDNLKAHVSLDTRDDGDVQYFLYKNGMVTGQKLNWEGIADGGMARNEQRRFNFTNSDGKSFIVGVDVARYSDLEYKDETINEVPYNNLYEPSLTMRYLFSMNDAKVMAKNLTACPEGSGKWLEKKDFHFGRTQVPYTKFKKVGYRGEFIPVRHIFSDYWVYDDPQLINDTYLASLNLSEEALNDYLDQHLVSAVNDNSSGKIEVEVIPGNTGIRRGGYNAVIESMDNGNGLNSETYDDSNDEENNYQGFYFYDKLSPSPKTQYGNSRFVVFRYPASGIVENCGQDNPAYLRVYLRVDENTRYQLAEYTLYFDANMATRPWTEIKNGTNYANNINKVKGTDRDPNELRKRAGYPIAKVTFDYPKKMTISETSVDATYHYPSKYNSNFTDGKTKHNGGDNNPGGTIANSSPVPLTFGHTNYAFDGDDCNWGSYAIVTRKGTAWGNQKTVLPADDDTYGYGIDADPGMQKAFMYIDASEQPGDICAVDFEGEFCPEDSLMCTGWISGSNKIRGDTRCPGSITLTVKGEDKDGNSNTIYRFCPGQIYELNNGYGDDGNGNAAFAENAAGIDGNGNGATHVVWQQFFFKFATDQKYERYWLEVNNNCVSSNGGDFMIDNVEVYTIVPEVEPEVNTPLCISVNEDGTTVTDLRLLKLRINYNKLKASRPRETSGVNEGTAEEGFVFLEKKKFLEKFKTELISWTATLTEAELHTLEINDMDFSAMSVDALADSIAKGRLHKVPTTEGSAYKKSFDNAILGNKSTWHSDNPGTNMKASVLYFRWSTNTTDPNAPHYMHPYSFADAVNRKYAVFYEVDATDGEPYIVMNGNFPGLNWKTNTDYYVINTNAKFTQGTLENPGNPCEAFNLCSTCCKFTEFRIEPPLEVLGLDATETTEELVACDGQIPTLLTNLKGYDIQGKEVKMKNLNFDWWLGNKRATEAVDKLATLDNYHKQYKMFGEEKVYLAVALATMRAYYPDITSLDGISEHLAKTPHLTEAMISYLQDVVDAGELLLHQTTISVPAEKVIESDPYFYLVACPIHDDEFNRALNPSANEYVAFYCDEPQGVRIKLGQKAPRLQTGFVPGERGFESYDYAFPEGTNPVLSIRLAKAAQFETVKNTASEVKVTNSDTNEVTYTISEATNYLWLPIRNAETEGATGVIKKAKDDNIYLASSNDLTWDKKISKEINDNGSLPIVGRIVELKAINTKNNSSANENSYNRLSVYFVKDFNVREGYNYTLSLPFQEDDDSNACDGTILINLKIVPDYEVWTGAAENTLDPTLPNTDWNNDENWRRADGNTTINNDVYGDELYRANGAVDDEDSPLHTYTTNKENYYSSSKKANAKPSSDQIHRKGFAPLYCTHILMKSDEWGNAPVLYDALDKETASNNNVLKNAPFPNLRETATPILKFDMQARKYSMWSETYGSAPDRGSSLRPNDLIAEMYQINSCDEIAFQPGTELRNAYLLNYNTAWMEYQLENKRWYLLGSPLQGTISGEWYAPTGSAKQQTTYYDDVKFGDGYDRYSPAIYQRSWDKAKAVLYEIGSTYTTTDDSQTGSLGSDAEGIWSSGSWQTPTGGADEYLDRLGYKPMGGNKANVAIQGIWSNTYNDAQVDYATGGFSVMVMNHLKNQDTSGNKSIIRLPKEDTMYDYYEFSEDGSDDGGTDTNLSAVQGKNRAKNRGRLKTDQLLPTQAGIQKLEKESTTYRYGHQRSITRVPTTFDELDSMNDGTFGFSETVAAGISHLDFYLVENPFPCGLDMAKFFEGNPGLDAKYWLLTKTGQHLVQWAEDANEWLISDGTVVPYDTNKTFYPAAVLAPGQGFFVKATTPATPPAEPAESITINFNKGMQAQSRFGVKDNENGTTFTIVVGQSQDMEPLKEKYDSDEDGDIDDDDEEREVTIRVDTDGDGVYDDYEPVMVPVYIDDPDNPGTKIPSLQDIEEDVVIYKYKKENLIPDDTSTQDVDETTDKEYPLKARATRGADVSNLAGLVITAQRGGSQSSALVMQRSGASNDFLPSEDTETFITSDLKDVPMVYTLCGRLATTINSIHDFSYLPVGVESASNAPCTLTFNGVELLGDSVAFYDAVEQKLTPLESGMQFAVSGQTQNRYYIVRGLDQKKAAEETHLQIFTEGLTVKVIASTAEPIVNVRCFDTAGQLIHAASPQSEEYSFTLPRAGVYIIEAQTDNDRKTVKILVK